MMWKIMIGVCSKSVLEGVILALLFPYYICGKVKREDAKKGERKIGFCGRV
jgi:hypothetical protein